MMVHNIQKPLSLIDTDHTTSPLPASPQPFSQSVQYLSPAVVGSPLNGNYSLQGGARLMTELSFYIVLPAEAWSTTESNLFCASARCRNSSFAPKFKDLLTDPWPAPADDAGLA